MGRLGAADATNNHITTLLYSGRCCVLCTGVYSTHITCEEGAAVRPPPHSEQSICKYAVKQLSAECDTDSETGDWAWHQTSRRCQASDVRHLTSAQGWHPGHRLRHHDVQRRGGHHCLGDGLHFVQPRHDVSDTSYIYIILDTTCFDVLNLPMSPNHFRELIELPN